MTAQARAFAKTCSLAHDEFAKNAPGTTPTKAYQGKRSANRLQ